jgi:ribosomal protein S3AE
MTSQYFIGDIMTDSANSVQQGPTVIEIRPFRGGWQCFEARGVQAKTRNKVLSVMRRRWENLDAAIRVHSPDGSIQRVIPFGISGNES